MAEQQAVPAPRPRPTFRTRTAVQDAAERSGQKWADANREAVSVYSIPGGYEARAAHMGAPGCTHLLMRTLQPTPPKVAPPAPPPVKTPAPVGKKGGHAAP